MMGDWEIIYKFSQNRKRKVELGTADGLTSILISRNGGQTITIDHDNDQIRQDYLAKFGILAINRDTADTHGVEPESVDFLYIDANHEFDAVMKDYEAWIPMVAPDGVILFHDINPTHPGTWEYYNVHLKEDFRLEELVQYPVCESSIKVFRKLDEWHH
jgi:predicted O-methyltransferase YrrM